MPLWISNGLGFLNYHNFEWNHNFKWNLNHFSWRSFESFMVDILQKVIAVHCKTVVILTFVIYKRHDLWKRNKFWANHHSLSSQTNYLVRSKYQLSANGWATDWLGNRLIRLDKTFCPFNKAIHTMQQMLKHVYLVICIFTLHYIFIQNVIN